MAAMVRRERRHRVSWRYRFLSFCFGGEWPVATFLREGPFMPRLAALPCLGLFAPWAGATAPAACEFEASAVRGGSAEPMARLPCQTRLTRERTEELRRQLNCPEGDLGCLRPVRP